MKDWNLLVWLTQLGLSVAAPMACCVILGVWLHRQLHWGVWAVIAGVVLGLWLAIDGLRRTLRIMADMDRRSRGSREEEPPPVSFNDHD